MSKHENKIASLIKENLWNYVRSKVETDSEATTDIQKAEPFNRCFSTVFTIANMDNIPHFPDHSFTQSLSDISITPEDKFINITETIQVTI